MNSSLRLVALAGLSLGAAFACSDSDSNGGSAGPVEAGSSGVEEGGESGVSPMAGRPAASGGRASAGGAAGAPASTGGAANGGSSNGGSAGAEGGSDDGNGIGGAPDSGVPGGSSGEAGAGGSSGEAGAGGSSGEDECPEGFYGASCEPCDCATGYCDDGRDGDGSCDPCPRGHTGEDCSECLPGFQDRDGNGICLPVCTAQSCSGRGACSDLRGALLCECDAGYAGASCNRCASGYQDNDDDGACALACSDETCSGNGECSDDSGATACECDEGHLGVACELCDDGYQDNDDDGACLPECTSDACDDVHVCDDTGGTATCVCPAGYAGDDCTACAQGYVSDGNGACVPDCIELSSLPADLTNAVSAGISASPPRALEVADIELVLGLSGSAAGLQVSLGKIDVAERPVLFQQAGDCATVAWNPVVIRDGGSVPLDGACDGPRSSPPTYAPRDALGALHGPTGPGDLWTVFLAKSSGEPLTMNGLTLRLCAAPPVAAP